MWKPPKIWKNSDVWIIGGGPSVTAQFSIPSDVVKSVMNGEKDLSVYSPYMKAIHNKHVIGVNVSYKLGDWVDFNFFGDKDFLLKNLMGLMEYGGIPISCHAFADRYNFIKYMPKNTNKTSGISTEVGKVCWNLNSGGASISLAHQLGAKRIFLLGFDMHHDKGTRHWHGDYINNKDGINHSFKYRKKVPPISDIYALHLKGFPNIKKDAERLGIEIYNVSPKSSIETFEKITLEEALCK